MGSPFEDETPTPRADTPFISSAPIFKAIADWWAQVLDDEARHCRGIMPHRARLCDACCMRMRALALDFSAVELADPGHASRRALNARWLDAQAQARELLPGREYGS